MTYWVVSRSIARGLFPHAVARTRACVAPTGGTPPPRSCGRGAALPAPALGSCFAPTHRITCVHSKKIYVVSNCTTQAGNMTYSYFLANSSSFVFLALRMVLSRSRVLRSRSSSTCSSLRWPSSNSVLNASVCTVSTVRGAAGVAAAATGAGAAPPFLASLPPLVGAGAASGAFVTADGG